MGKMRSNFQSTHSASDEQSRDDRKLRKATRA